MKKRFRAKHLLIAGLIPLLIPAAGFAGANSTTTTFKDARLKIEYNSTDGDAGLQVLRRRRAVARDKHFESEGQIGGRCRG
ncbi:MAG: hypothetical protein ACR2FO_02955 [Actinomycetota bacterium]